MSTDPEDMLVADLIAVLRRLPGQDKHAITASMLDDGWMNLDVHSVNSILHMLKRRGQVAVDSSKPPKWSLTTADDTHVAPAPSGATFTPVNTHWSQLLPGLFSSPNLPRLLRGEGLPDAWWLANPGDLTSANRDIAIKRLATALIAESPYTRFRDEIIGLPLDASINVLPPVTTRSRNVLMRAGISTIDELAAHSVGTMSDWRQVGLTTLVDIVSALMRLALGAGHDQNIQPAQDEAASHGRPFEPPTPVQAVNPRQAAVLEDLAILSHWRQLRLAGDEPLFAQVIDDRAPAEVQAAQVRLSSLKARDLAPLTDASMRPDVYMDEQCRGLTDRELDIARTRLFAEIPATLDTLGKAHSLTRERIRQLETRIWDRLVPAIDYGTPTGDLASVIKATLTPVSKIGRLINEYPVLAAEIRTLGKPLWLALDKLDDDFEVVDGWAAAPTVENSIFETWTLLEEAADRFGLVSQEDATQLLPDMNDEDRLEWLSYCRIPLLEGSFWLKGSTIADRAGALLNIRGRPQTAEEIQSAVLSDRATGSIRNAMAADPRFVRVDRDRWGLSEWGFESYTGIRDLIGRRLDAAGGSISLQDLVDELVAAFGVSPSSVSAYASSQPYEVHAGTVRRRLDTPRPRKLPRETRRLFRHLDGWRYRIRITEDHLRGSGFSVPVGFASIVGCDQGQLVVLQSALGPQQIRWTGQQPNCGSIRRFLEHEAVDSGDEVFLSVDHGTSRFGLVRLSDSSTNDPLAQALALAGLDSASATVDDLKFAVGLPAETSRSEFIGTLRDRGDTDIEELLLRVLDRLEPANVASPIALSASHTEDILGLLGLD